MKTYIKKARQPEIIRTTQKDLQYTAEITQNLLDVVRVLSKNQRNFLKFSEITKTLSNIFYHGFAAVNKLQTLGEEYTGIIQIDESTDNLPARFLMVISIVLESYGESFLLKLLKNYEAKVCQSEELVPEARESILKLIRIVKSSLPYLRILHRGFFYLNSGHFHIAKRFTGINYVLVRFWLNEHQSVYGYKFLGIVTILQVVLSLFAKLKQKLAENKLKSETSVVNVGGILKKPQPKAEDTKKCVLCLEPRTDLTATTCGHLFCWTCIAELLRFKNECPMCRETLTSSSVIFLQNYC